MASASSYAKSLYVHLLHFSTHETIQSLSWALIKIQFLDGLLDPQEAQIMLPNDGITDLKGVQVVRASVFCGSQRHISPFQSLQWGERGFLCSNNACAELDLGLLVVQYLFSMTLKLSKFSAGYNWAQYFHLLLSRSTPSSY